MKIVNTVNRGFTLIELLIVIAVVGVLAVGVATAINPIDQIQKGSDTRRKTDLSEVQKALELYYQDNNRYPDSAAGGKIRNASLQTVEWGASFTPYMQRLPDDPKSGRDYVYVPGPNGTYYVLYATLERGEKDTAVFCGGIKGVCTAPGIPCGTGVCNYRVYSANAPLL